MALISTAFTSPTSLDFIYETRAGWKYVPFVRKDAQPLSYQRNVWYYNGGNTHTLGSSAMRAGGIYWGEKYPAGVLGPSTAEDRNAYARAYAKVIDKLGTQAALLTAAAERQATVNMVVKRLAQIHKGAKHLKKGQFRQFLATFGLKPKEKHTHKRWARPRDFASLWLEYWMGWAPTIGDIHNAIKFLGEEIPTCTVRAGSRVPWNWDYTQSEEKTKAITSGRGFHTVWVQCQVKVINPTLWTMQGLGLANPLKTIWEVIPFSWFVDWFTNIGKVLGQVTDFLGLQVKNCVVSRKSEATCTWVCENAQRIFGASAPRTVWRSRDFVGFMRTVDGSLPTVKPTFRIPNGLSITRGATLVSLIVQLFAPKKGNTIGV